MKLIYFLSLFLFQKGLSFFRFLAPESDCIFLLSYLLKFVSYSRAFGCFFCKFWYLQYYTCYKLFKYDFYYRDLYFIISKGPSK
jgi:hypothetical protein